MPFQICGVVAAFQAATLTATGLITIAGQSFILAMGATGQTLSPGLNYCLSFTFSGNQVIAYATTLNLPRVSIVCGVFTSFVAVAVPQPFIVVNGMNFFFNPAVFSPLVLVSQQVYCFLLSPSGFVLGILNGIPTLATTIDGGGGAVHRAGRLLAQ